MCILIVLLLDKYYVEIAIPETIIKIHNMLLIDIIAPKSYHVGQCLDSEWLFGYGFSQKSPQSQSYENLKRLTVSRHLT